MVVDNIAGEGRSLESDNDHNESTSTDEPLLRKAVYDVRRATAALAQSGGKRESDELFNWPRDRELRLRDQAKGHIVPTVLLLFCTLSQGWIEGTTSNIEPPLALARAQPKWKRWVFGLVGSSACLAAALHIPLSTYPYTSFRRRDIVVLFCVYLVGILASTFSRRWKVFMIYHTASGVIAGARVANIFLFHVAIVSTDLRRRAAIPAIGSITLGIVPAFMVGVAVADHSTKPLQASWQSLTDRPSSPTHWQISMEDSMEVLLILQTGFLIAILFRSVPKTTSTVFLPQRFRALLLQEHNFLSKAKASWSWIYETSWALMPRIPTRQLRVVGRLTMGPSNAHLLEKSSIDGSMAQNESSCVTWECTCGMRFSENHFEVVPGGIRRLQRRLRESRANRHKNFRFDWWRFPSSQSQQSDGGLDLRRTGIQTGSSGPEDQSGGSSVEGNQDKPTVDPSVPEPSQPHTIDFSNTPTQVTADNQPTLLSASAPSTKVRSPPQSIVSYLLLCLPDTLCGLKLRHQQLIFSPELNNAEHNIHTDRQLFQHLQKLYWSSRNVLASTLALKTVVGVSFAKFGVTLADYVNVYPHTTMCQNMPRKCKCFPPRAKLVQYPWHDPTTQAEYWCTPVEFEVIPPISTGYLTHCFQSPKCINEAEVWVLNQLPKRFKGELKAVSGKATSTGWGLVFEEGWNVTRIGNLLLIITVAALLFGILWAVFQKDVQGGFSITACMIAVVAAVIGFVGLVEPRV